MFALLTTPIRDQQLVDLPYQQRYPTGLANEVYSHTVHGDRLRALLVDLRVWKGKGAILKKPQY
jgi:hypothetical protein